MRCGPTEEPYTHPSKEGKLIANDFTSFMPERKKWDEARDNGRPNILFQYECTAVVFRLNLRELFIQLFCPARQDTLGAIKSLPNIILRISRSFITVNSIPRDARYDRVPGKSQRNGL
jgi:hypothetical protein